MTTIEQREQLRMVVLNFLAQRKAAAFTAMQIENRLKAENLVDFNFNAGEITDAALIQMDLGLVREVRDSVMGVVPHYQATAKGVLESEHWRLERGIQ